MYCNHCQKIISTSCDRCPDCGFPVSEMSCMEYINHTVKSQSTFLSAQDFLQGAKPLRLQWVILAIGTAIGAVIGPLCMKSNPAFAAVFMGIVFALLTFLLILLPVYFVKYRKINSIRYRLPLQGNQTLNAHDLGDFLCKNLSSLPFTQWEVGNPSVFGLADSSSLVIQCLFAKKTIHRIVFEENKDTYRIIVQRATMKHILLFGRIMIIGLLYKSAYFTQPILAAAIEYYIKEIIRCDTEKI